jgi:hypothetical protein
MMLIFNECRMYFCLMNVGGILFSKCKVLFF